MSTSQGTSLILAAVASQLYAVASYQDTEWQFGFIHS